ncbi:MAG: HDOD domain-containing protein [Polyangiales bacterium]
MSTSSETGLFGWFRRLFASPAPVTRAHGRPVERAAPTRAPRPAEADAKPTAANPTDGEVDPRWHEQCPQFAGHAHALGLPFDLPLPLSAADEAQVEQLAVAVRADSAANDSEPSASPAAALRVLQLVARSDLELAELASVIQQDSALTAAVLRVANSAAMSGAAGAIQTVRDAVTRLGVADSARVVGVVATAALFNPRSKLAQRLFGPRLADMHVASAAAASGAAQLSMERGVGRSDKAFLGGMLHGVGKSLAIGALARLIDAEAASSEVPDPVLEALLDRVHVELGTQAHERWKLPQYLIDLCAKQHEPLIPLTPDTRELHLVRVASGLIALRLKPQSRARIGELTDSLLALQITPVQTRAIDAGLRSRSVQVRQVLSA